MIQENTDGIDYQTSAVDWVLKNFALIVDGEVAGNYSIPIIPQTEKAIAIFQSNPTIVETQEKIQEGSTWDGQAFTPPV
jgi:hypothetical protein